LRIRLGWGPNVAVTPYVEGTIIIDMVDAKTNRLVWRAITTKTGSCLIDVQKEKKVEKIVSDAFKHSSQLGILIHGASRERHPVNFVFNIRSCPDAA